MRITNCEQAVEYLESFIGKIKFEIAPEFLKQHDPLTRMRVLLDLLGNPQNKFPSILVGGTSGKGSTAYLVSHILTIAGYKTGLTISPHLQKINERLQINGKPISEEDFTKMAGSMVQIIELMKKKSEGAPSYFEILIAMAFLYFAKQKVDIAIVEVGMGGEFDATNTLYPLIALLTNVSLDHTNILGGTVQKIAKTKAEIIKKIEDLRFKIYESGKNRKSLIINHKSIVVTGVKQPSVIKIVEDKCKEVGAELFRLGKDFDFKIKKESLEGTVFDLIIFSDRRKKLNGLELSLLGRYQTENASLAVETVLQLEKFGLNVSEEYIRQALKTAFFPGRFEVISCYPEFISGSVSPSPIPSLASSGEGQGEGEMLKQSMKQVQDVVRHDKEKTLILDGAHNPTKMKAFLSTLKKLYPRNPKIFIIAFKKDKNIKGMIKEILKAADAIIITEFKAKTDMSKNASKDVSSIKYQVSSIKPTKKRIRISSFKNSKTAMDKAFEICKAQKDSIIVVTGSLYLAGEIRTILQKITNSKLQITNKFQLSKSQIQKCLEFWSLKF